MLTSMMFRPSISALHFVCLCASLHAADPDEVRFKPKSYTPRKALKDSSYQAASYAPSGTARSVGQPLEQPRSAQRWNPFRRAATVTETKQVHEASLSGTSPYTPQKHISVPTISADSRDIPEKKPFEETGKQLADKAFSPAKKPQEKNPLLRPRQGIKEPE